MLQKLQDHGVELLCSTARFIGAPKYTACARLAETLAHVLAMGIVPCDPWIGLRIHTDTTSRIREFSEAQGNGMHAIPDLRYSFIMERMVTAGQMRPTCFVATIDGASELARVHRAAKYARIHMVENTQRHVRTDPAVEWWALDDDEAIARLKG